MPFSRDGKGTSIGYARVPAYANDLESQVALLIEAGCAVDNIFVDRDCSAQGPRPQLDAALSRLSAGDTLIVYRLDGPARSLKHLVELTALLLARGIHLRSLCEAIDTRGVDRKCTKALLDAFLGADSALMRERAIAGLSLARARGRNGGAKERLSEHQQAKLVQMHAEGQSVQALGKKFGITRATVYRYLHKHGAVDSL